jgi:cytochrome c556
MPRRSGSMVWLGVLAITGLAVGGVSCSDISQDRYYQTRLANTGEPAMHGVNNDRLRELMGDIDRLSKQGDYAYPLELRQRQNESIEVSAAMERSVAELPRVADKLQLTDAERETFLKMAAKLEKQVKQFNQASQNRNLDEMRTAMDLMMVTCNSCHSAFRQMKR